MELTDLGHLLGVPELAEVTTGVESFMTELLASADAELAGPSLRILRGRGKRLRPALVIAAAACGPRPPDHPTLLAAAAAVEFLHIGSLVHDDIMDHAEDRRGVAAISFREGPNTALLCGDVLFALSGHAAAMVGRAAAIECAETIVSLCNGQIRELVNNFNPGRSEQSIFDSIEGKTAALLRTSCRVGGLSGGLDGRAIDALGAYGHSFGMSFQLVDDVLDFVASRALTGKPVLNDLRGGVYTLPVALALRGEYGRELLEALELPENRRSNGDSRLPDAQVAMAVAILRSGDYFRRVLDLSMDHARLAAAHLSSLPDVPAVRGLARLPTLYVERQLEAMANAGVLDRPPPTDGFLAGTAGPVADRHRA